MYQHFSKTNNFCCVDKNIKNKLYISYFKGYFEVESNDAHI